MPSPSPRSAAQQDPPRTTPGPGGGGEDPAREAAPSRRETRRLFNGAARGYRTVAQLLTAGQYLRWRDRLVQAAVSDGLGPDHLVLDVATGTGLIARGLHKATGAGVIGVDLSPGMLRSARSHRDTGGLHRRLVVGDATRLPFPPDRFDALTMSYLLRYVDDPQRVLTGLVKHVKPGGFFAFIEFHVPPRAVTRALWRAHTRVVLPAAGALFGPGWWRVGRFLSGSIESFWTDKDLATIRSMMQQAGLTKVHVETMSLGGAMIAWGRRA